MRNEASEKILNLITLLLGADDYTGTQICEKVGISRRSFYYLMEFLRNHGFIVFKANGTYHIDRRSPFIANIADSVKFTNEELRSLKSVLSMFGNGNDEVNSLRQKLEAAYDFKKVEKVPEIRKQNEILRKLIAAIQHKQVVRLAGYSSPHSHTVQDRIVEPYLMMNNNRDVRCHEISTSTNKTFKLARMDDVEILDEHWTHEGEHRQVYTDIFMFSGEEQHNVKLRLGQLAHNLFLEEYPQASRNVQPDSENENHWILELVVCDYRGIGRFVLGLFDDIDIIGCDSFKKYIDKQITMMYNKNFPDINGTKK